VKETFANCHQQIRHPPKDVYHRRAMSVSAAERIEEEASLWLAARDARAPSPDDAAAFDHWIEEDIRHRVAYLRLESASRRSDRLQALSPPDRSIDKDLLRASRQRNRWPLALAASVVLVLMAVSVMFARAWFGWEHYQTLVGGFSRIVLDDGSVIDLNTDSELRVRMGNGFREVRLVRGEGRFQAAHDTQRPFVVSAGDAVVRAVGTVFSVRLRKTAQVEVLVAEGAVEIDTTHELHAPPLHAGEAAVLHSDHIAVSRIEPQQLEQRLAWTSGKIQLRGETLDRAIGEFNRYNRRKLRLADASLAELRVVGTFNATDPDSFAAALSSTFGVRVESAQPDAIVLRTP